MQFIHEEDMTHILMECLRRRLGGIYNVAGEGTIRYSQVAALLGRRLVPLPAFLLYPLTEALWRLRVASLADGPAAGIPFIRYPWVADASKLKRALGIASLRSSREALLAFAQQHQAARAQIC